ncbi:MAG: DUF5682 family protein, partial [Candidatus Thorarchaeota archaeon]
KAERFNLFENLFKIKDRSKFILDDNYFTIYYWERFGFDIEGIDTKDSITFKLEDEKIKPHLDRLDYLVKIKKFGLVTLNISTALNFHELIEIFKVFVLLYTAREVLIPQNYVPLEKYISSVYDYIIMRIPSLGNISEEQTKQLSLDFRSISQIITLAQVKDLIDVEIIFSVIEKNLSLIEHPRLIGLFIGFLYTFKRISENEIEKIFYSYSLGTKGNKVGHLELLEGILSITKAIIFSSSEILKILDEYLNNITEEEFIEILPITRRIFSVFSPKEIDIIGTEVGKLFKTSSKDIRITKMEILDNKVKEQLLEIDKKVWGILEDSMIINDKNRNIRGKKQ